MPLRSPIQALALSLGDVLSLVVGLWLALFLRLVGVPEAYFFSAHFFVFLPVFAISLLVWFVAGLYQKSVLLPAEKVSSRLLNAQAVNAALAIFFFYLVPAPGILPKTILFFYIVISTGLVFLWRYVCGRFIFPKRTLFAILVSSGEVRREIEAAALEHKFTALEILEFIDPNSKDFCADFKKALWDHKQAFVIADCAHPSFSSVCLELAPDLSKRGLVDATRFYEDLFERVPFFDTGSAKLFEVALKKESVWYLSGKRILDFLIALPIFLLFLLVLPLVYLLIKLEDGGSIFVVQERLGQFKKPMRVYKLRTMRLMEDSRWLSEKSSNQVTRAGSFLRRLSIDELPQLWNIIRGELSFIGPRSDLLGLSERLSEAIPGYDMRYLVTPGITGWAQINQMYSPGNISPQSIEETKVRLAYDLFYLKRRSLGLDLLIALKTLRVLLARIGV